MSPGSGSPGGPAGSESYAPAGHPAFDALSSSAAPRPMASPQPPDRGPLVPRPFPHPQTATAARPDAGPTPRSTPGYRSGKGPGPAPPDGGGSAAPAGRS